MRTEDVEQPDDPWLTVSEIATELRCSPATIRSWIRKGTLPAMRPGQRKLLVRRSDLDRMLGRDPGPGSAAPPPSSPRGEGAGERGQIPDAISSVTWSDEDRQAIDPDDWLGVAQWEWLAALDASRMAPPDAWFVGRLTQIAEAAARKADALTRFADDTEVRWENEPAGAPLVLSYELRPGGNRPGSLASWARFDAAVDTLGQALEQARAGVVRSALEALSLALHDIVDELRRVQGRSGMWRGPAEIIGSDEDAARAPRAAQ